ncbi:MAG TPA: hypothetical protein PLN89_06560, partial [Elusimicrobiota bacterium]|nr:hypothetical protein [Elusimicrobiota bacterium]
MTSKEKPLVNTAFLIPSLPELGVKSSFSILNPIYRKKEVPRCYVEMNFYRDSVLWAVEKVELDDQAAYINSERDPAVRAAQKEMKTGDLAVVKIIDEQGRRPAIFPSDAEGQLFLNRETKSSYATVLYGFVPIRPSGSAFSPVLHYAHYLQNLPEATSHMVFCNYNPTYTGSPPDCNRMKNRLLSRNGDVLKEFENEIPFNSTRVVSINKLVREDFGIRDEHVVLVTKGGKSQFAIFTVNQNTHTGNVGIEHSLPPYYYSR